MEKTMQIINAVFAWVSGIGGATILTIVVKALINAHIHKKPIKLTAEDKSEIAGVVAKAVASDMEHGITVDVDAVVDRATNHRVSVMERKTDDYIAQLRLLGKIVRRQAECILTLKSPDGATKDALREAIESWNDDIDLVAKDEVKGMAHLLKKEKKTEY